MTRPPREKTTERMKLPVTTGRDVSSVQRLVPNLATVLAIARRVRGVILKTAVPFRATVVSATGVSLLVVSVEPLSVTPGLILQRALEDQVTEFLGRARLSSRSLWSMWLGGVVCRPPSRTAAEPLV